MICQKYKIAFIFSLLFVSLFGVSSCFAINSYTYEFNTPIFSPTPIIYSPNNNPYNFIPKYLELDIQYLGTQTCGVNNSSSPLGFGFVIEDNNIGSNGGLTLSVLPNCSSLGNVINIENIISNYDSSRFSNLHIRNFPVSDYKITVILYDDNPHSSGGIVPEGVLNITENGSFDVTNYAEVNVNVPQTTQGQYHDDLMAIKAVLLIIPATLLVLYFFYCIYRIIISYGGSR